MNVTVLAHANGWHTVTDLGAGLAATDVGGLVTAMLRRPDGTMAERNRRDHHVAEVLAGAQAPQSLLTALAAERFDASAAAPLLKDPAGAADALIRLISDYGRIIQVHEHAVHEPPRSRGGSRRGTAGRVGIYEAAERLFPQWKFHDLAVFDSVC